ncbi:THO complex subunit 2 [Kappamyces sp. JEL0680]|nr:THO complex subunit 2 [Kappamyces sp. JEL0680]
MGPQTPLNLQKAVAPETRLGISRFVGVLIDYTSTLDPKRQEDFASALVDLVYLLDQWEALGDTGRKSLVFFLIVCLNEKLVTQDLLLERLESDLLEAVQLIPDAKALEKKMVRMRTSLLYKQTKFNLLREESEGYSKLVVALNEQLPPSVERYWSVDKSRSLEDVRAMRQQEVEKKATVVLENIYSLIGYFDLDPNRVLDIVLDAFCSNFMDSWDFFICVFQKSPWKPTGEPLVPSKVLAQILGFKFSYYHGENAPSTPLGLIWVAALLIKEGILGLDDFYPHLSPLDDKALRQELGSYLARVTEAAGKAGRFAPTKLMGSLDDIDLSGFGDTKPEREPVSEVRPVGSRCQKQPRIEKSNNQRAEITRTLAALGDLKNVRVLLERNPLLSQIYPEIADNMSRILHVVLQKVEKPLRPLWSHPKTPTPDPSTVGLPIASQTVRQTALFDQVYHGKKFTLQQYSFFYDKWRDHIPQPATYAGVSKVLRSLLVYIGPHLYRDVLLVGKLIRIGKHHRQEAGQDEAVNSFWLAIIAQFIFPAVSQLPTNPGLANELWSFLKLWPYATRYALYGEWHHTTYDKIPELAIAAAGCRKDIQYIMNRLSKDNIKTYGRHIGKIVHSNPTIAFSYILNAIESYDNMIPFVVEATRYLTDLEFDILCFCLIEALARKSKVRVERNGTTLEKWLKSLSTFCGTLFAKYKIELEGILQYLMNQFLSNQVYDLVVFQDLISSMTGISPTEDITSAQLDGISGGPVLRRESLIPDPGSVRKSSIRLVKALQSTDLAIPFAISIAQHRKEIAYRVGHGEDDPSRVPGLKVLAWLNDSVGPAGS